MIGLDEGNLIPEYEQALDILCSSAPCVADTENIPLNQLYGRIASKNIYADIAIPPFDRSKIDGFAVRHDDVANATPKSPARLFIKQTIVAGSIPVAPLDYGVTAYIMTGAMLPQNCDCVIWKEDTRKYGKTVLIEKPVEQGANCQYAGSILRQGQLLVTVGEVFSTNKIGILASQGLTEASAFRRPRVALVATGNELCPPGRPLPSGKIYDSNSVNLCSRLKLLGMEITENFICQDNDDELFRIMSRLIISNDMLITTGGVSNGIMDRLPSVVYELLDRFRGRILFETINIRPGYKTLAARFDSCLLLALSGNPFSATSMFELLCSPILKKISGRKNWRNLNTTGYMQDPWHGHAKSIRRLVAARLFSSEVSINRTSGIKTFQPDRWNCFVDIPAGVAELAPGARVDIIYLDNF